MTHKPTTAARTGRSPARSVRAADASAPLAERYESIRRFTEWLCEPLVTEDYVIQTMPDVSPTKWHLAHTSWFFETLVLKQAIRQYRPYAPEYEYLFNSYYNTFGEQYCRPKRGLLSRPTVDDVYRYRAYIDEQMAALFDAGREQDDADLAAIIELGLQHEQQHQELILTDIKHVFAANQLRAVYGGGQADEAATAPMQWLGHDEGVVWIGHEGKGFAYDNETPHHRQFVHAFELADRPVTCGEYLDFINDGGYRDPRWWLSDGWATVKAEGWEAPLYWERDGADEPWRIFTLAGRRDLDPDEPVCHVSFYEAEAYAAWAGARLPSEAEWELISTRGAKHGDGNLVEAGRFHPAPVSQAERDATAGGAMKMLGDVWEWTSSAYQAYPGYVQPQGALGEYNGKFMCNQMVLRGGSCATSRSHIRPTYRNFFPPDARWQFSGIRIARNASP